ncbi:MAG: adenosine deaminase [Clostridia bacterium]|nr:adenosine deaminase [Clostridia bacterium]
MKNKEKIENMKKIMLHLHLDGSLRPETVLQWLIDEADYKTLGFENKEEFLKTDRNELLQKVKKALMVSVDCRDLNEYLEKFDLPCKQLQTENHITQATYELFEDLSKQNVIYAEVRFAPSKHREKGLDYDKIVEAAIKGMNMAKEKYHIGGSLILCAMRGDNEADNLETIKVAKRYLEKGVSAVDLAGAEALFLTSDYENIFREARNLNIPFTIHAGEAAGAESIKKALDFGATRIGHGVRCLEDPQLVDYLVKNNVVLEVCPISNLQTKATGENHPIEEMYRKQLKVTVNTDNDTVSNTNIINEYEWVLEHTKLDLNDLKQMNINAVRGLFIVSEEEKEQLIEEIEKS